MAKDFFSTFTQLPIAADSNVLVGELVNYVRDTRGVHPAQFATWNEDIEAFLTEVHSKIATTAQLKALAFEDAFRLPKVYTQMLFLFASVLNEVQDGPCYDGLAALVGLLSDEDALITFNWDTLLDRALFDSGEWHVDGGYGIDFLKVYDDGWRDPAVTHSRWRLLKLHGSTNWLMPYYGVNLEERVWKFNNSAIPPGDRPIYCYLRATKPYATYKGRYRGPYQPFSYYYYPPDLPIPPLQPPPGRRHIIQTFAPKSWGVRLNTALDPMGKESMPVLVAPIQNKDYGLMGGLIQDLWTQAQSQIERATELAIIGYSFPPTDVKAIDLLARAVANRSGKLLVTIVNPYPADIADRLTTACGSKIDVTVRRETLEEYVS